MNSDTVEENKNNTHSKISELECDQVVKKMPGFGGLKTVICSSVKSSINRIVEKMKAAIQDRVENAVSKGMKGVLDNIKFDFKPHPKYIIKGTTDIIKGTTEGGRRKYHSRKTKQKNSKRKTQKGGFGDSLASAISMVASARRIEKYLNRAIYNANKNDFNGAIEHDKVTETLLDKIGDATKDETNKKLKNEEYKTNMEFKKILAKMIILEPKTGNVV